MVEGDFGITPAKKRYDHLMRKWILIAKPNGSLVSGVVNDIDNENGILYLNPFIFEAPNREGVLEAKVTNRDDSREIHFSQLADITPLEKEDVQNYLRVTNRNYSRNYALAEVDFQKRISEYKNSISKENNEHSSNHKDLQLSLFD